MSEVIVITSGKGGVGKTTLTANIGSCLASKGYRCVLIDTDIGLRNLDVIMGLENRITYHLIDIIEGKCRVKQALIRDREYPDLFIIPSSQRNSITEITNEDFQAIITELKDDFDYILIDCPAGIEEGFKLATSYADKAIVVTTPDIASLRDADKVIHVLEYNHFKDISMVINKVIPELIYSGDMIGIEDIFDILQVPLIGMIPFSKTILLTYNNGEHITSMSSYASKSVNQLCERILGQMIPMMNLKDMTGF